MPLHCTLVRAPGSGCSDPPLELTIQATDGSPGSALAAELSHHFFTRQVTVNGEPLGTLTVGRVPLVNGAILVDGVSAPGGCSPRHRSPGGSPAPLFLTVQGGPAAGRTLPLGRGSLLVGRTGAELALPDPAVSRAHARIDVSDRALTITDLDSSNGTFVDDRRVRTAAISTRSVIRCGNSTLAVVVAQHGGPGSGLGPAGRSVADPLVVANPFRHESRTGLYLGAALPLVLGLGLALATGMWMFLALTAVSAVSLLVPVLGSRRQRRELRTAVADASARDVERRRASAPTAAELVLAPDGPQDSGPVPSGGGAVWLRLGLADQDANVRLEPAGPGFHPPALGRVALQLDPAARRVTIRGREAATTGLMHFLLMQLTGFPRARGTQLAIYGPAERLPLAARYLPATSLHARPADVESILQGNPAAAGPGGVLMILAGSDDAGSIAETAFRLGWRVFDFAGTGSAPGAATIELGDCAGCLRSNGAISWFTPDLVPLDAFERYCRGVPPGGLPGAGPHSPVPGACLLGALIDPSPAATARRWAEGRQAAGLAVPIGCGSDGPELLDVEADGPHVLVAGTTGSGKSELVRSLIAALALNLPPDCINFLFFDFKGGSGLGPLQGLPHCAGMLTDLTQSELDRTLASLRAEIRRREMLLTAAHASDLGAYRLSEAGKSPALPRLLLVIDEFRILLDDAPHALREIMRIAAVGRSLGIHLVMATQRPQGALSADLRANVTTSIALRVQSGPESTDIIGTGAAAAIDVKAPGRAYLARGSRPPREFQGALLSFPARESGIVSVRLTTETLARPEPLPTAAAPGAATPEAAAASLVRTLTGLWATQGYGALARPVAAPLPDMPTHPRAGAASLSAGRGCERCGGDLCCVDLGSLDLPAEQRVAGLSWHPGGDGNLALIDGGATGDATGVLSLVVDQVSQHPAESHLYILDAHGSLADRTYADRAGAVVGLHELRRGVRVLERLCGEMSRRLGRPDQQDTPLVLVIAGWGSWRSALRSGPLFWAEDLVHDLARDGHGAGIAVLMAGGPELAASKFLSAFANRVYFPRSASPESRLAWPTMPAVPPVAGRAVAVGTLAGEYPAVCQFHTGTGLRADSGAPLGSMRRRPFRIDPLPRFLPVERLRTLIASSDLSSAPGLRGGAAGPGLADPTVYIGAGGDEVSPVAVRLPRGGVVAVLGGSGSGKSAFLTAIAQLNPAVNWLSPALAAPGEAGADREEFWSRVCRNAADGGLDRNAVLLVDDADRLSTAVSRQLSEINDRGWTVIFSADYRPALALRVPLAAAARNSRPGILIAPRSPQDGDLFGQRFELDPHPPPGRAVLVTDGAVRPVQLAFP